MSISIKKGAIAYEKHHFILATAIPWPSPLTQTLTLLPPSYYKDRHDYIRPIGIKPDNPPMLISTTQPHLKTPFLPYKVTLAAPTGSKD